MRWQDCEGLTEDAACRWLFAAAGATPFDQSIVEIGVYRGKSLLAMAEGSLVGNCADVYGVDPWNLPRPSKAKYSSRETYEYAMGAISTSPAEYLIYPVRAFGAKVASTWRGNPVGLLYVDADHRHDPVLADYADWKPHLAPGAVLCWDDYHSDFPGVITAVNELHRRGEITKPSLAPGCSRLAVAKWSR